MEQFDLSLWLKDKSRKVVTREGNVVEIIYTNGKGAFPVIVIDPYEEETEPWQVTENGKLFRSGDDDELDLFFADEEPETIEVPFGAKDSEFIKDEYFIPEGCEARIEGNKVIIEKIQKEGLTEFEQKLVEILKSEGAPIGNVEKFTDKDKEDFHCYSKQLLDLARKELEKDYCIMKPFDVSDLKKEQRELGEAIGRTNALKDLPKWKKGNDGEFLYETSIVWTHNETKTLATAGLRLDSKTIYIPISELEKLPMKD